MQEEVDTTLLDMMKSGSYFWKHDFGRNKRSRKHMKLSPDGLTLKWKAVGANEVVAGTDSPGGSSARGGVFRSSSFSRTTSSALPTAMPPQHGKVVSWLRQRRARALQMPPRPMTSAGVAIAFPITTCTAAAAWHAIERLFACSAAAALCAALGAADRPPYASYGAHSSHACLFAVPAVSLADVSHIIYGPYTDTFAKKTPHDRVDARWACFSLVLRESRTVRALHASLCYALRVMARAACVALH